MMMFLCESFISLYLKRLAASWDQRQPAIHGDMAWYVPDRSINNTCCIFLGFFEIVHLAVPYGVFMNDSIGGRLIRSC